MCQAGPPFLFNGFQRTVSFLVLCILHRERRDLMVMSQSLEMQLHIELHAANGWVPTRAECVNKSDKMLYGLVLFATF